MIRKNQPAPGIPGAGYLVLSVSGSAASGVTITVW